MTKAKALKRFIEPIITKSKTDSTHNRRIAFSLLRDKKTITELFREVASKVGDRPGGYTRVIKVGNRLGDNASMAMIELVDFNEIYNTEKITKKKTRRRSGTKNKVTETIKSKDKVSNEEIIDSDDDTTNSTYSENKSE